MTPTRTDAAVCSRHRRKDAVGRCASCGVPLCRECMVDTRVGFKCTTCAGGAPVAGGNRRGWARPVAALAALAAVAVVALVALGGDGGDGGERASEPRTTAATGSVERRVQFDGAGDTTIAGTLSLPEAATTESPVAAVVIIPGFGPTTREGVARAGSAPDTLYRDLGSRLVADGMATLRYDKRGTGQSVVPPAQPLTFDDMVADAGAAVTFLAEQAEIDPARIAVVGHEEGGLVGLELAGGDPRVASLTLVSVPGRPLLEVLTDDFNNSGHADQVEALRSVAAALLAGEALPATGDIPPFVRDFFPANQQGYVRDIFSLDPVALASEVEVPVLIVRGDASTGISQADADALVAALGPDTEVMVAQGAGPTLQVVQAAGGGADASDPLSPSHDHGAGGSAQLNARSEAAMDRISQFVTSTT